MCKKDWRLLEAYKKTGLEPEEAAGLAAKVAELEEKLAWAEGALADVITAFGKEDGLCSTCANEASADRCAGADYICCDCLQRGCPCRECGEGSNWEWRGLPDE